MGLFTFLKRKNRDAEAAKTETLTALDVDPAMIDPPETRYTKEYQAFLAEQEAAGRREGAAEEATGD